MDCHGCTDQTTTENVDATIFFFNTVPAAIVSWYVFGQERIFAIGDVHGCIAELEALLGQLKLRSVDRIVFLGDLVNRGPDSLSVLKLVRKMRNTRCILGNHELRLLKAKQSGDLSILKDYDWPVYKGMDALDWEFLDNMDLALEIPREQTVFVHGGFLPRPHWREQSAELVTDIQVVDVASGGWGRRRQYPNGVPWQNCWEGPPFVICGHTPRVTVLRRPWSMCIDTGCVYGGKLTALEIRSLEFFQVDALANYIGKPLEQLDTING